MRRGRDAGEVLLLLLEMVRRDVVMVMYRHRRAGLQPRLRMLLLLIFLCWCRGAPVATSRRRTGRHRRGCSSSIFLPLLRCSGVWRRRALRRRRAVLVPVFLWFSFLHGLAFGLGFAVVAAEEEAHACDGGRFMSAE